MKHRLKMNTAGEQAYIRDLERHGPLERVASGESRVLLESEYPEPLKRFLARHRRMLHVQLSASTRKKLEQISKATGIDVDELARRWVEQGIAKAAG